jgi:glutamate racemase
LAYYIIVKLFNGDFIMDNRPIGVFDSGLGGLTAVRELRRLLPNENIIYFGDTGRMPYGGRPREQMRIIAGQNIAFAESFGVKAILAACGTISSNAPDILENNKTKAIGVLKPGTLELAQARAKRLGVIATKTSIESGAFQAEISSLVPDSEVTALACPEFVPVIESGHYLPTDSLVREVVARSLEPLKGVGALLLGCTHYGLIADAIREYLGSDVILVGAADASARALAEYLNSNDLLNADGGSESYYTSGDKDSFKSLAPIMLGYELKSEVCHIEPFPLED